jgi:hypothetical protein
MSNSSDSSLNLFFPLSKGGLNKQQFISDIFNNQINRGTNLANRSGIAKVLYDDTFPLQLCKNMPEDDHNILKVVREKGKEHIVSFNPNLYQEFEESYSANKEVDPVEQKKYNEYVKFMTKIGTSELSVLQPFIKLVYRYRKNKGEDWKEFVIPFPSFTTEEEFMPILSSKFARGDGCGIESVTTQREFPQFGNFLNVKANISFYFQNLGILTRELNFPNRDLPTPFSFLKVMAPLSQETEQIVLEYGYSLNTKFTDPTIIPPGIQEEILRRERKRFILNYYRHNFNIEQNGSVRLTVDYTSKQDFDLLKETSDISITENIPEINALSTENPQIKKFIQSYTEKRKKRKELEKSIKESRLVIKKRKGAARIRGQSQQTNQILKLEKKVNIEKKQLKTLNIEINSLKDKLSLYVKPNFLDSMISHMDVFKINFATKSTASNTNNTRDFSMKAFLNLVVKDRNTKGALRDILLYEIPTSFSVADFKDNIILSSIEGVNAKQKETLIDNLAGSSFNAPKGLKSTSAGDKKFGDIVFFPVRALIAAAYRQLNEDDRKIAHFTSLGNINARSLGKEYVINMGDILVELTYFQKWFYEHYTKKGRLIFTLGEFVEDVVKKLVPSILEDNTIDTFGKTRIGSIQRTNYLTEMQPGSQTRQLFRDVYHTTNKLALRQLSGRVKRTSETRTRTDVRTFVHYSLVRNPSSPIGSAYLKRKVANTNFREDNDIQFGCPHIKIGADEGLLKNISFNANDFAGMRLAFWSENLRDTATNLLRYHYSANVETIGNNVFFKGGFFGIPSNLLGIENDDFDPGISGYYAIQRVNDSISLGNYTTNLTATWFWHPRLAKAKGGESVKDGQNKTDDIPPTRVGLSLANYFEEILRLDAETLAKYGIGPNASISRAEVEEAAGVQKDTFKDIKENF